MVCPVDRARKGRKSLQLELLMEREQARPVAHQNLLPPKWYPRNRVAWDVWLTQLEEGTSFNGHLLTNSVADRMIAEAERNEAEARANGTHLERVCYWCESPDCDGTTEHCPQIQAWMAQQKYRQANV